MTSPIWIRPDRLPPCPAILLFPCSCGDSCLGCPRAKLWVPHFSRFLREVGILVSSPEPFHATASHPRRIYSNDPRTTPLCSCFPCKSGRMAGTIGATPDRAASSKTVGQLTWDEKGDIMNMPQQAGQGSELSHPRSSKPCPEREEEARKIRRLQVMISMVMSVIGQDPNLTVEEASELAAGAKRAALAMFPDKELAYDLLYKPRLQRLMKERFRLQ